MRCTNRLVVALLALLVLTTPAAAVAAPSPAAAIPDGWSDGFVYSNGARLHYYRAVPRPGKPILVMLHGITDNGLSWTTLTRDLQDRYDIYMLDARAHGLSDPYGESSSGDVQVEDAVGFLRAMKLGKPILMGHSMGAATVMRLAATYPDLPRAVILLDPRLAAAPATTAGPQPPGSSGAAAAPTPPRRVGTLVMAGPAEAMVAQNNDSLDELVAACAARHIKWDPEDCRYWAISKRQYHGPYSPAQAQAMRGGMAVGDALRRIVVPTLILKADAAPDAREADVKAAKLLRNGRLVHLPGTAHNLHHDDRAGTVRLVQDFIDRL